MHSAQKLAVVLIAFMASGSAEAAPRHHRHVAHLHRHSGQQFGRFSEDTSEGVYSRHDDRVYGGAYYGFYGSPLYGRYQGY